MYENPTVKELVESVARYLENTAMPNLTGHAAFHGRVAVNVLGIVARELAHGAEAERRERERLSALLGHDGDIVDLRRELCAALRDGRMSAQTPGLVNALLESAVDRVRIEQPNYGSLRIADAS